MVAVILVINRAHVTMLSHLRKTREIDISGKIEIGQLTALLSLVRCIMMYFILSLRDF